MKLKLQQIEQILTRLADTASVSITSVENLARELFTHRGAGTLIRKGERIVEFDRFDEDSRERTRQLLETSFDRRLRPDYFDKLQLECVLASESFGAMAIVLKGVDGIPYLDKFAVTPEAQGAGLGRRRVAGPDPPFSAALLALPSAESGHAMVLRSRRTPATRKNSGAPSAAA